MEEAEIHCAKVGSHPLKWSWLSAVTVWYTGTVLSVKLWLTSQDLTISQFGSESSCSLKIGFQTMTPKKKMKSIQ